MVYFLFTEVFDYRASLKQVRWFWVPGLGALQAFCACVGGSIDDAPRSTPPDIISNPSTCTNSEAGQLPAFPGAKGFGAYATGGRGGRVIKVTTLDASGPGSLQSALNVDEPRTIVFEVSGVIEGDVEVPYGNATIAGQSAPGAGITIKGRLTGAYNSQVGNIIIRHIRVRPEFRGGDGNQFDAIQFSRNTNLIFDHVSASFALDETVDIYSARNVTIQWSTIESSATEGHPEGEHNYGLISGPNGSRVTLHHNLFAHHKNRNPALATGPAEVRNNVIYNARHGFVHHNAADGEFNIVGNYFRKGPSSPLIPFFFDDENNFSSNTLGYFLKDNFVDDDDSPCAGTVDNPWEECSQDLYAPVTLRAENEYSFSESTDCTAVETQPSPEAYETVLSFAGAFPRDAVTKRSIADTRSRTGKWGVYPVDLLDGLVVSQPLPDQDNDGMPDPWEQTMGLDPEDPSDQNQVLASGYTAVEVYLNQIAVSRLEE